MNNNTIVFAKLLYLTFFFHIEETFYKLTV